MRPDGEDGERGSTLPLVLVCWLMAALMAFGAIAASDAFLEQQQVQSVCWLFLGGQPLQRTDGAGARAATTS